MTARRVILFCHPRSSQPWPPATRACDSSPSVHLHRRHANATIVPRMRMPISMLVGWKPEIWSLSFYHLGDTIGLDGETDRRFEETALHDLPAVVWLCFAVPREGLYSWRYRFVHRTMRSIFLDPSRGFDAYLSGCLVFSDAKLFETLKHIRQTYHVEQDSSGTCGPVSDHGHVDLSELPHAAITRRSLRCLKN